MSNLAKKPDQLECVSRILQSIWNLEAGRGVDMGPVNAMLDMYAWKCCMRCDVSDKGKVKIQWLPEMDNSEDA